MLKEYLVMFEISDKVVCIDDKFEDYVIKRASSLPQKDQIYVVRGLYTCNITRQLAVYLVGIQCEFNPYQSSEYAFWAWRFRKLSLVKEDNRLSKQLKMMGKVTNNTKHDLLITL